MKKQLSIKITGSRTLCATFEAPIEATKDEMVEAWEVQRFNDTVSRFIADVLSDLRFDIDKAVVAEGRAELTDDVNTIVKTFSDGLYAKDGVIVYWYTANIVCDHTLPDCTEAINEAVEWVKNN